MKAYSKKEHFDCDCYEKGEHPALEVQKLRSLQTREMILLPCNEIIFVVEGKALLKQANHTDEELRKGQFIFLPMTNNYYCKAILKSKLLIVRLKEGIRLCDHFSLEALYHITKEDVEKPQSLVVLDMNIRLRLFVEEMVKTLEDGLKCRVYFDVRIKTLFMMIRNYYNPQQLRLFFYPILSPDVIFSEQVRMNCRTCSTVNDLAKTMGMTAQHLTRRFNHVFGQSPYKWMQQERARLIYSELNAGDDKLKEIAKRYGFTTQGNFNRFCQSAFSMSPGDIRKKRL